MGLCITTGAKLAFVAASSFTLTWTHTVQKTEWQEDWAIVDGARLQLTAARVKGSGAGMEPPPDALRDGGWWHYRPDVPPLSALDLADHGGEAGRWRLCAASACRDLASDDGAIAIRACSAPPFSTAP
ncbi:MAG: DUF1850 domain-containing protein [Hyphomicrobiaceae bacterium]